MSHYTEIATEFKDQASLEKALKDMGCPYEVHKEPKHLEGYKGDVRPETATIIIPRHKVGESANDIGFAKQKNGSFKAIISEFDRRQGGNNAAAQKTGGYNEKWIGLLKQRYGLHAVTLQARKQGYRVSKPTVDQKTGEMKLYLER